MVGVRSKTSRTVDCQGLVSQVPLRARVYYGYVLDGRPICILAHVSQVTLCSWRAVDTLRACVGDRFSPACQPSARARGHLTLCISMAKWIYYQTRRNIYHSTELISWRSKQVKRARCPAVPRFSQILPITTQGQKLLLFVPS